MTSFTVGFEYELDTVPPKGGSVSPLGTPLHRAIRDFLASQDPDDLMFPVKAARRSLGRSGRSADDVQTSSLSASSVREGPSSPSR